MPYQSLAYLGYQQLTDLTSATALTLPVGAQQAQASSCSLSGSLLTVGGTVTGAFAIGQVVRGTGIPANTYIAQPGSLSQNPTSWWLSNPCSTETGEEVTAYEDAGANVALISVETEAVRYLPGGGTPTVSSGIPIPAGNYPPLVYDQGDLAGLSFIEETSGAVVNVAYYRAVAID